MRSRRLLFITGKGGTGKSTVAAALAIAAARRGRRTIVAELAGQTRIPASFGRRGAGLREIALGERLTSISIEPQHALREYLRLQAGPLGALLAASRAFGYLTAAAPGLSELVTVGKVWELAQPRRRTRGAASYDLVIVDAPSSGHCVALLRAPATFAGIARRGPIARQARAIAQALEERGSGALIVTLAEEMAVSEALELREQLARSPGIAIDAVVVNRVYPQRFGDRDARRASAALERASDPVHRTALRAALSQHARRAGQAQQLTRLDRAVGAGAPQLPQLPERPLGQDALAALGERLAGNAR